MGKKFIFSSMENFIIIIIIIIIIICFHRTVLKPFTYLKAFSICHARSIEEKKPQKPSQVEKCILDSLNTWRRWAENNTFSLKRYSH